jgi:hypothetical protein
MEGTEHRTPRRTVALATMLTALPILLAGCAGSKAVATPTTSGSPTLSSTTAGPTTSTTPVPTQAGSTTSGPTTSPPPTSVSTPPTPSSTSSVTAAPAWLGRRVLPLRADGYGVMGRTPAELDPRRIATVDVLPPPAGGRFRSTVSAVPAGVAARSTWAPECPVALADLRYVTVSFIGFDGAPHTGELLVNRTAAAAVVRIFAKLYAARYPIEQMTVTTVAERDAPPTGDGNDTGAFNCRSAAGSTHWSQHAYGLAIDVNPFINPYIKGDVVLPELARAYTDRGRARPGLIVRGDVVVRAFAAEGWIWGGAWRTLKDYQHFSPSGT